MADTSNLDLLRLASEYASQDVDLFELLGVDALTPKDDVHRAWRKLSVKYHPDKLGDAFDPEKWELLERARDILADEAARAAYDGAMKAKLLRRQEREEMDRERRKFADDLEAAEGAARAARLDKEQRDREAMQKERDRLAEARRMREEETRRQAEAAQEIEDLAEAKRRLKEKREEKVRRKMHKEAAKAAGRSAGPANGVVLVPGSYVADLGAVKKQYWELVCDKLRAVQAVRNLAKSNAESEELLQAEKTVQEARRRIAEAETKFTQETA
jgi:DnaJ family protein C protein 17